MVPVTLTFALLYLILGVGGFVLTGSTHKTALIPCIFGLFFVLFGLLALKDNLRKHVMHAAVLVALLAFLGTARSLPHLPELFNGTAEKPAAVVTQAINAALSLAFIVLAIRSFIQARRTRNS
ncbi:MAG: hypothetical protein EBQ51_02070 [Verrucomicrobia bacterium]|nr:hypothetical protein [Pseudomonadota bacterium]NBS07136.1 hypothetical protein [Verrucomicrobiota bacterium]NBS50705.1 hypothetical protein [Verrucomicrobiota bacterium]NBY65854.1 hypothetical protein [Verrucomicrobiota bacterium]